MSHKIISGLASAAIGLAVLGGAGSAVAATPATVPAGHSHHDYNVCWNVNFYRANGEWHVRWTDDDGRHHEKARTFKGVLKEFKDECDRVVRNKNYDRDHRDNDRDHKGDRDHRDNDRDHKDDRDHKGDKDDHDRDHKGDRHDDDKKKDDHDYDHKW